jgi:hypothetical protein
MLKFLKYEFVVFTIVCTVIVIVFMFVVMPQTAPHKNLIRILKEEKLLKDSIGSFKRIDRFPDHDVHYKDSSGYGKYWIWVHGTEGKAGIYIKIINDKGTWKKDSLEIYEIKHY